MSAIPSKPKQDPRGRLHITRRKGEIIHIGEGIDSVEIHVDSLNSERVTLKVIAHKHIKINRAERRGH